MTSQYVTPPGAPNPPPGSYPPAGGYGQALPPTRRPRKRGLLVAAGLVMAIVLAVAALAVGIVALKRHTPTGMVTATPGASSTSPTPPAGSNTTEADRALCNAIAPLMAESDREAHEYIDEGPAGSPQRDSAIAKYRADTQDWTRRAQAALDAHSNAQPYFKRTLQRFIDDQELLVANVRPGPSTKYDEAAYDDSMVAYGGPLAVCQALGVQW
jgi:uncharacterized membrane protein